MIHAHDAGVRVTSVACPGLAPAIQDGDPFDEAVVDMVREYTAPLVAAEVDTAILGCTHYPVVEKMLRRALPGVTLVKSGEELAREVADGLRRKALLRPPGREGALPLRLQRRPRAFRGTGQPVPADAARRGAAGRPGRGRPRGLAEAARPVPVERELVTLRAADGAEHDALLHLDARALRARERRTGRRTAVMHVHGIMGNFLVGTLRFLPGPLARAGYPTLVIETRMGNIGQVFGQAIFDDALIDLDAGVRWLRARGFDHVVLSGYSSGAAMATRFAAVAPSAAPARPGHLRQPVGPAPVRAPAAGAVGRRAGLRRGHRAGAGRPGRPGPRPGGRPAGGHPARPRAHDAAPRRRDPHLPHLAGLAGARTPSRPCPAGRSAGSGRRSCSCRARTTRWSRRTRPSGWPPSPARPATPTSRWPWSRASGTASPGGEQRAIDAATRWLARRA